MTALLAQLIAALKAIGDRLSSTWAAKVDTLHSLLSSTWAAKVDTLHTLLSSTWAAKLDTLHTLLSSTWAAKLDTLESRLSSARASKIDQLDASISSRLGSIKSIQRGVITLASVATNTATVTAVNTSKALLMNLGNRSNSGYYGCTIELTDSTTITAKREIASGTSYVSWQLVEFN